MTIKYVSLPLYPEADYQYFIALNRVTYRFRLYYNERMKRWMYDIRYANDDPIVLGEALVSQFPILADYQTELTGILWLEPIGEEVNQTTANPFELYKYYRLFYIYDDGTPT